MSDLSATPLSLPDSALAREARRHDRPWLLLKTLLSVVLLLCLVALSSSYFRQDLSALGHAFVLRFGLPGMFIGTFAADALSVPLPPMFYLLTAVAAGSAPAPALCAISAASIVAGHAGYCLAQRLARRAFFRRRLAHMNKHVDGLFARYGYWAVAIGTLTPLPYSLLCYAAGVYRMPYRLFSLFTLLRVPRLLFIYMVIRAGWAQGGP